MRLAFDEQIFAIQEFGGISRLFAELAKQYTGAVPTSQTHSGVSLEPMHAPIVNRYILGHPEVERALDVWDAGSPWRALGRYFTRRRPSTSVDVLHSTFYLPHGLAGYPGARRIVTVHDMIPELLPKTRRRLDFITLKRRYVMSADHLICVSEATRQDLLRCYGPIPAPITVVHHGVDPAFQPGMPRWEALRQAPRTWKRDARRWKRCPGTPGNSPSSPECSIAGTGGTHGRCRTPRCRAWPRV
jgi:glycosyltransferase involved in cell wall biosynthesis